MKPETGSKAVIYKCPQCITRNRITPKGSLRITSNGHRLEYECTAGCTRHEIRTAAKPMRLKDPVFAAISFRAGIRKNLALTVVHNLLFEAPGLLAVSRIVRLAEYLGPNRSVRQTSLSRP